MTGDRKTTHGDGETAHGDGETVTGDRKTAHGDGETVTGDLEPRCRRRMSPIPRDDVPDRTALPGTPGIAGR